MNSRFNFVSRSICFALSLTSSWAQSNFPSDIGIVRQVTSTHVPAGDASNRKNATLLPFLGSILYISQKNTAFTADATSYISVQADKQEYSELRADGLFAIDHGPCFLTQITGVEAPPGELFIKANQPAVSYRSFSVQDQTTSFHYAVLEGDIRCEAWQTNMGQKAPSRVGLPWAIYIYRSNEDKMYFSETLEETYIVNPFAKSQGAEWLSSLKIERLRLGNEETEGHQCVKYKITIKTIDGILSEGLIWEADKLNQFPIKIQSARQVEVPGSDTTRPSQMRPVTETLIFKNIKLKRPDPALFKTSTQQLGIAENGTASTEENRFMRLREQGEKLTANREHSVSKMHQNIPKIPAVTDEMVKAHEQAIADGRWIEEYFWAYVLTEKGQNFRQQRTNAGSRLSGEELRAAVAHAKSLMQAP